MLHIASRSPTSCISNYFHIFIDFFAKPLVRTIFKHCPLHDLMFRNTSHFSAVTATVQSAIYSNFRITCTDKDFLQRNLLGFTFKPLNVVFLKIEESRAFFLFEMQRRLQKTELQNSFEQVCTPLKQNFLPGHVVHEGLF